MKTHPKGRRLPYRTHWQQCRCGKVVCDSEVDAKRKATAQQFAMGVASPFDVYPCGYVAGVWHWTHVTDDEKCSCGRKNFSQAEAVKTAQRVNRGRSGQPVQARSYECPHGGHHWLWYPAERKFRYCKPDGAPAYPDESSAQTVASFIARKRPGTTWDTHRCDQGRWHIAERSCSD